MPYARNKRTRIYREEEGSGEPLLMIMGLSFSLGMWGRLRRCMAQRFRTILFDNRCVGKSDRPLRPFTIARMAADPACVLESAGVTRAHVVGLSMGGMIAQELALRQPQRVAKLVPGCTHCGGFEAVPAGLRRRTARLAALLPYICYANTPHECIDRDPGVEAPGALGYLLQLGAILTWRLYNRLPQMSAPTLVVHGDQDRLVPPANGAILGERIPGQRCYCFRRRRAGRLLTSSQTPRRMELTERGWVWRQCSSRI